MANDYPGSIAQQYISFSALFSISTNPGASFGKSMIFVDAATLSGVWQGSIPAVGTDFELTSQDYTDFASGGLLAVLQGYASAPIQSPTCSWPAGTRDRRPIPVC